jgi:hypothetical protein
MLKKYPKFAFEYSAVHCVGSSALFYYLDGASYAVETGIFVSLHFRTGAKHIGRSK